MSSDVGKATEGLENEVLKPYFVYIYYALYAVKIKACLFSYTVKEKFYMNYTTDNYNSYTKRTRNSTSFFFYISQMLNVFTLADTADI